MNCLFEQQETVINYSPRTLCRYSDIYTSIHSDILKIRKLSKNHPEECIIEKDDDDGLMCRVPSDWIRISPKKKINLTDEERAARAEQLRKNRSKKDAAT